MKIEATQTTVFTQKELAQIALVFASIKKAARWNPLFAIWIGILSFLQVLVFFAEYELAFQIYDYVAGEERYWNTHLMAVTGILFIIGFHVLAHKQPDNIAVRIVTVVSMIMLPLYALGLGFLVMSILYGDGLADLIAVAQEFTLFVAEAAIPKGWLEFFFEQLASPFAVVVFAFATGGLAVVNLYVSHNLITSITTGMTTLYQRHVRYNDAKKDYAIIQTAQERFQDIAKERSALAFITPVDIATDIAAEVLVEIQAGLTPHKQVLKRMDYDDEPLSFLPSGVMPDPKQLNKDIEKIDRITTDDILKALNIS